MRTLKDKIIEIVGFGMELERAECKADEILKAMEDYNATINIFKPVEFWTDQLNLKKH